MLLAHRAKTPHKSLYHKILLSFIQFTSPTMFLSKVIFRFFIVIIFFTFGVHSRSCYSWDHHAEDLKVKDVISIADTVIATIQGFYVGRSPLLSIMRSSVSSPSYQRQSEILNRILISTGTDISYTVHEPFHVNDKINLKFLRIFNLFFVDSLDGYM